MPVKGIFVLFVVSCLACGRPAVHYIQFSGRFVGIERLDQRYYKLLMKDSADKLVQFVTLMPIGPLEISMLRTSGNYIWLSYYRRYNPVTKDIESVVRSMKPLDFSEEEAGGRE